MVLAATELGDTGYTQRSVDGAGVSERGVGVGMGVFVAVGSVAMEGGRCRLAEARAAADVCVHWSNMGKVKRCSPGSIGNDVGKTTKPC